MTIRTRRKIFYTLVALFIIIGGGVVFYAQGWRLDFATWRFEKVGGIYVRAYPENAAIYLNGKSIQNQSGFLSPGTLISDLLPRTYSVTLKAPGYDAWQENAAVEPTEVVQFKYAVLIPATSTLAPSSTAKQIALAIATGNDTSNGPIATTTNPFNPAQKIVITKNELSLYNIAEATTTATTTIAGKNIAVKWISGNIAGILQDDGELYLYDTNAQTLTKLADDVTNFSATDDGSMIAALEQHSLEIFSPGNSSGYYRFNLPDIADATQVIWYRDLAHLFIAYPDHIAFLDLADSGLMNYTTVSAGTNPYYDEQANDLYLTTPDGEMVEYSFPE